MAIAYDNQSSTGALTTGDTTLPHTCAAGASLIVFVHVETITNGTCTGVTYNGVAMTASTSVDNHLNAMNSYAFYLASPASGTHDIVVKYSSATDVACVGGISVTGANTGSLLGTTSGSTFNTGSPSKNINTANDNSMVVGTAGWASSPGTTSATGANQTQRWTVNDATDGIVGSGTTQTTTTAGTYTDSWSGGPSSPGNTILLEVKAAVSAAVVTLSNLTLLGVG